MLQPGQYLGCRAFPCLGRSMAAIAPLSLRHGVHGFPPVDLYRISGRIVSSARCDNGAMAAWLWGVMGG